MKIIPSPLQNARRIVVKIGSSLITNHGNGIDSTVIADWAAQIAQLRAQHKDIIIVSSGAIAEGICRLGFKQRPAEIHNLQACAAVGQMGLAHIYQTCFAQHNLHTAQVLLTHADLMDRTRYLNARSTLLTLLQLNVIPIINENDTVVTDEIKFGDNDTLAALVTNLVEADVLVILTDQSGLFTADPRHHPDAQLVSQIDANDSSLEQMAGGAGSAVGRGGMITKISAAKRAATSGAHTLIAAGREKNILLRLATGEVIGTQLLAQTARLNARKQWMADHLQTIGKVILDQGAVQKLIKEGKSLLPIGVQQVIGEFARGDVIACLDPQGVAIAHGLVNYSSSETHRIIGKPSGEIEHILGFIEEPELIHRNNLALLSSMR